MEGSMSNCKRYVAYSLLLSGLLIVTAARAQDINPPFKDSIRVYVDTVVVNARRLHEENPVGPYRQSEWTMKRRFPSTRVYIQTPPGEAEFEQWLEVRVPPSGSKEKTETRVSEELEFGLDKHFQLDLYLNMLHVRDNARSVFEFRGWATEVRWAPSDWNELPGNPTLYLEYMFFDKGTDKIEPKLLLGGEIPGGWHWGVNLTYERELAAIQDRTEELAGTAVFGYTLFDQRLSIGPSFGYATETVRVSGSADVTAVDWLLGPSIQFRPHQKAFLDIEPLFGLTRESMAMKMFIVFGWEL